MLKSFKVIDLSLCFSTPSLPEAHTPVSNAYSPVDRQAVIVLIGAFTPRAIIAISITRLRLSLATGRVGADAAIILRSTRILARLDHGVASIAGALRGFFAGVELERQLGKVRTDIVAREGGGLDPPHAFAVAVAGT